MAEKLCLTMGKGGEAKVYIYNHGVESFGGLVTGYNSGVTPTRTKYSNYYYMRGVGNNDLGSNGSTVTDEAIDLTNYSKVGILFKSISSSSSSTGNPFLVVTSTKTGTSPRIKYASGGTTSINNVRLEYDISDLNGSYYVGFGAVSGRAVTWTIEVEELYLIP